MPRWLAALALVACSTGPGGDEVKLGRRSRDAGPAVIIVDRGDRTGGPVLDEKEPDDARTPQALVVPGSVRGRIDADGDVDVYRVAIASAGTLRVSLSGIEDADLVLEAQQPGGELIASSDNGPAKVAEGFPNLFVQPGVVHLVVREFKPAPKKKKEKPVPRAAPSQPYLLSVSLGPPPGPGEEREPNDASAFADEISLGQAGRGYVGGRRDSDVWRVPLEGIREDEALAVDVDGVEGVALKVSILDGTGAVIMERKGRTGAAVALRSVAVREKSPIYFVVVTGDKPNDAEPYTLRVAPSALVVDEEVEPNDGVDTANPLADAAGAEYGARVGTLGAGDVDVYRLEPAEAARRLSATVTPPASADVELAVVGKDGVPLVPPMNAGKKGAEEKLDGVPVPAGAEVFVKVVSRGGGETERYRLRWAVSAD